MRYGDWDVLLFRTESRAPIKEFKVACQVIDDREFTQAQGSFGLPNVSCFIPSQDAGTLFHISVHSWEPPNISPVTSAYSKHIEDVRFEARLFIDGRLTASSYFERRSMWPHVITKSFHFSRNGDLEPLRFPVFRQELLLQNHWHPGDDIGRIKIIISEGFPRDSTSMPFERVKNLVAFSFQHAPLDVLEHTAIAWPNPIMWQRHARTSPMPVPTHSYSDAGTHAHSPRRITASNSSLSTFGMSTTLPSTTAGSSDLPAHGGYDKAELPAMSRSRQLSSIDESMDWIADVNLPNRLQPGSYDARNALRKVRMSTDESMPDFRLEEEILRQEAPNQSEEESLFNDLNGPSTTPVRGMDACSLGACDDSSFSLFHPNMSIPIDLANSLTSSILSHPQPCQPQNHTSHVPAPEIKSRKETRLQHNDSELSDLPASNMPTTSLLSLERQREQHHDQRRVSQQMYIASGESLPTTIAPLQTQKHHYDKSRKSSEVSERTASIGEIGVSMSNMESLPGVEPVLRRVSGNSEAKGIKNGHNPAPSSSKIIDEIDQPRQSRQSRHASPQVRLTPFVEDANDSS